jgi:MSHA pilin protein MshC
LQQARGTGHGVVPRLFLWRAPGFTMPELIAVIVIIGVLATVAAPRLGVTRHGEGRLYQETLAALRYAQSSAVAKRRTVCVSFTATTATFTYDPNYGTSSCSANLVSPSGGTGGYVVTAQSGATYSAFPATFSFDWIGKPNAAQSVTVSGGAGTITIESESGYVH